MATSFELPSAILARKTFELPPQPITHCRENSTPLTTIKFFSIRFCSTGLRICQSCSSLATGLRTLFAHSSIWNIFYEKQLGNLALSTFIPEMGIRLDNMILSYIIFVNTIITILPKPKGVVLNQSQVLCTALNCVQL
ncbi:hypothetical protein PCASD_11857 [Puccinia coronata f. sp. avenae]|uniref:Uncharacterized protein n=1 Tax=Puccinia coronata f. sp. avenae TaxID=200324 RepID=A0A2N5UTQ2_9BASI|nr:hypothetical protein PCASD_11857 [Puccinia coronata f. sp. avenae]